MYIHIFFVKYNQCYCTRRANGCCSRILRFTIQDSDHGGRGRSGVSAGLGRRDNRNTRPVVTKYQLDAQLAEYTAQVWG